MGYDVDTRDPSNSWVTLAYTLNGEEIEYRNQLVTTRPHFGGRRWWFGVTPEQRDALERGLRDSIRQTIQPSPNVNVDFLEEDGRVVARVFVLAGWQRHSFEGRYYVRRGSQSVYLVDDQINDL